MPTKQPEQHQGSAVITAKVITDGIARAARIRGGVSPIYLLVQRTIKAIETDASKSGKTPGTQDPLYYDLKNLVSPLQRILRRSQEEYNKRLLDALEKAGNDAVETHRAEVRARRAKKKAA